ncbi:MAG: fibronectin type III domain-containing protein, partial [Propionibacteriales bacterium]|nr:fibronectin type III domain-containing protein [Propionibacteriales bacterium]
TSYEVYANGKKVGSTDGSVRSFTASVTNGTAYTFTVTATNKAGASGESDPAQQVTPFGAPSTPAPAQLRATGQGPGDVVNTWSAPKTNGRGITSYQVEATGGPNPPFGQSGETIRANPGDQYRVRFKACANDKCSQFSDWSNTVEPYGPPGPPKVSATGTGKTVTFSWSDGSGYGKTPLSYKYRTAVNGNWGDWQTGTTPNPITAGDGRDQGVAIEMVAVNTAGQDSSRATADGRTGSVTVRKGGPHSSCQGNTCAAIRIEVVNFPPNSSVTCKAEGKGAKTDQKPFTNKTIRTDGSGAGSNEGSFYGYVGEDIRATCDGITAPWYTWPP